LRALLIIAATVAVVACKGPVEAAEEQHRIAMASAASEDEKCAIERKLAEAYLEANAADKYHDQKQTADIQCLVVETERAANRGN
jgi:hypothetical protein